MVIHETFCQVAGAEAEAEGRDGTRLFGKMWGNLYLPLPHSMIRASASASDSVSDHAHRSHKKQMTTDPTTDKGRAIGELQWDQPPIHLNSALYRRYPITAIR